MRQTTSEIMMIRPASFAFNQETAISNLFQKEEASIKPEELQERAVAEFDAFVAKLRENGVKVRVIEDTPNPPKPDAIFPNNWISMHQTGEIFLYPMEAPSRRRERREDIIQKLKQEYAVSNVTDLSSSEKDGKYLEGTGSIVFDHPNKLAYACISPRTDAGLLENFCKSIGYEAVSFAADDEQGKAIYHTNVMMCMGTDIAVICLESITDKAEKSKVLQKLNSAKQEVVEISFDQMNHFAGNMLEVKNEGGEALLVMSSQAYDSLNGDQLKQLERHVKIVHSPIDTIERIGGGSARCMMAEIFLEKIGILGGE